MARLGLQFATTLLLLSASASATAQDETTREWEQQIAEGARDSVVRVETMHGVGAGFVFHEGRYIATAFHVVDTGRPVTIRTTSNEEHTAAVVAVDSDRDLAILAIEQPIDGAAPLQPRAADVEPGTHVMAIGHPYAVYSDDDDENWEGLLNWSIARGVVSAVGRGRIQTDAAVHPGNSGGPVLDENGHVVAVTVAGTERGGIGFATRVEHLVALVSEIDESDPYDGQWRLTLDANMVLHGDEAGAWIGGELGMGVLGFDQWAFLGRASVLALGHENEDPFLEQSGLRVSFGAEAQYRIGFGLGEGMPMYIALGLGAQVQFTDIEDRRLSLGLIDPMCDPATASCQFTAREDITSTSNWAVLPTASLNLIFGFSQVGYEFQFDPSDPAASRHLFRLGFSF